MLNPNLKTAFAYHRSYTGRTTATRALELARMDTVANRQRYPATPCGMRGGADWKVGRDTVFFCEQPDIYLRRVGFVDEIPNESRYRGKMVDHKGWYLEDGYSDELARGVVFQLPAHKGKCRFISAIADPHNDGPAILSLELFDDLSEAARNADQLAERYAETEREYQRAWRAGERYRELGEEITTARGNVREILRARRDHMRAGDKVPTILTVLECKARELIEQIGEARSERETLLRDHGRDNGFND